MVERLQLKVPADSMRLEVGKRDLSPLALQPTDSGAQVPHPDSNPIHLADCSRFDAVKKTALSVPQFCVIDKQIESENLFSEFSFNKVQSPKFAEGERFL